MSNTAGTKSPTAPRHVLDQVADPTNRLDCLLFGVVGRIVEQSTNPMVRAAYSRFEAPLAEFLHENVGPLPASLPAPLPGSAIPPPDDSQSPPRRKPRTTTQRRRRARKQRRAKT